MSRISECRCVHRLPCEVLKKGVYRGSRCRLEDNVSKLEQVTVEVVSMKEFLRRVKLGSKSF